MPLTNRLTLAAVEARAQREAEYLAGEFARAAAAEREEILAALEYEKWLAQTSREALHARPWRRR